MTAMSVGKVQLTPHLVQSVRDALDIVVVAEEHTSLERRGNRLIGLCPLHKEKSPSFSVDSAQNLFYCFGCGAGGDAIKLHMMLSGDDFPATVEALAERFGVPMPRRQGGRAVGPDLGPVLEAAAEWFRNQLAQHEPTLRYLESRGISAELADRYSLGFAPDSWDQLQSAMTQRFSTDQLIAAGLLSASKRPGGSGYDRFRNRLMFPIRQASGRVVGFGGRTLGDDDAKYINTRETERFDKGTLLYGLDTAKREIRDGGRAVLVEGYFDVLGAVAAGVEGVVACMGTSLTPAQARAMARYGDDVTLAFDGDSAGEKASTRALPILLTAGLGVKRVEFPSGSDPDTYRLEHGPEALRVLLSEAPDYLAQQLEQMIPADAPRQPQVQAKVAPEIGTLLSSLPDPILRYSYGRLASQRLGVPFELLVKHLGGGPQRSRTSSQIEASKASVAERTPGLDQEQAVVKLLITGLEADEAFAEEGVSLFSGPPPASEVFWDTGCRILFELICEVAIQKPEDPLSELRRRVQSDGGPVELLARLVMENQSDASSKPWSQKRQELGYALNQLIRNWLKERRRKVILKIQAAQSGGDSADLESLVTEKLSLTQEIRSKALELQGGTR